MSYATSSAEAGCYWEDLVCNILVSVVREYVAVIEQTFDDKWRSGTKSIYRNIMKPQSSIICEGFPKFNYRRSVPVIFLLS